MLEPFNYDEDDDMITVELTANEERTVMAALQMYRNKNRQEAKWLTSKQKRRKTKMMRDADVADDIMAKIGEL